MSLDLFAALATLSPLERERFVDRTLVGLTHAEIAERDGVSQGGVRQCVSHARSKLAAALS